MTHPYENRRDDGTNPGDQFRGTSDADRDDGRFDEDWGGDSAGSGGFGDPFSDSSFGSRGDYGESGYVPYADYDENRYADDDDGDYDSEDYNAEHYESDDYDGPAAYSGYSDEADDADDRDDLLGAGTPSSNEEQSGEKVDTFGGDKVGTVLIVLLGALAVIASILMLFTDSTTWMKIAVLAALWAGVIGGILTTRYRRQLVAERERVREIEERHRVELDKEIVTHREQELLLEQNYMDSVEQDRDDLLAELRAEVQALREHLVELIGDNFDEERVALKARAERLRELENGGSSSATPASSTPLTDPKAYDRPAPRVHADRPGVGSASASGADTRRSQDNDEPVDVPVVDNTPGSSATAAASASSSAASSRPASTGGLGSSRWRPQSGHDTAQSESTPEPKKPQPASAAQSRPEPRKSEPRKPEPEQAAPEQTQPRTTPTVPPKPAVVQSAATTTVMPQVSATDEKDQDPKAGKPGTPASSTPEPEPQADPMAAESRPESAPRGRRRAEDHSDGLTVAELLAQMRNND